jgi:hypothetical protein
MSLSFLVISFPKSGPFLTTTRYKSKSKPSKSKPEEEYFSNRADHSDSDNNNKDSSGDEKSINFFFL